MRKEELGSMDPTRPRTIITGVLREALRATGRSGIILSGGGPEGKLLEGWLADAEIPCRLPDPFTLGKVRELLDSMPGRARARVEVETPATDGEDPGPSAEAAWLSGWVLARDGDLLLAGTANKTVLLLSSLRPIQPLLPLGDLYASEITDLAGACTRPACLRGKSLDELRAVDRALEAYYGEGFGAEEAFGGLKPDLRAAVVAALVETRARWHPGMLIPKLGNATLGLDLDP